MNKLFILSIILITSVFFTGCDKEEEKPNQNPTCNITSPANGQEINKGETITISVDAEDNDGNIAEVRFFIDGVGQGSVTSFPYTYKWKTENESLGNHTLKVTSLDNDGGSSSDDIFVTIIAGTFTDPRDGQVYNTVTIDNQTWMAENLKYLPSVNPSSDGFYNDPYYYVYYYEGNNISEAKATANYQTYGVLYNWLAAKTACPPGWHLPSDEDWTVLTTYLGGEDIAGGKLKETGTTHWWTPNTDATNSSGFTALPGGLCDRSEFFTYLNGFGLWWSSTEYSDAHSWFRILSSGNAKIRRDGCGKVYGFSVRCLKN